MRTTITNAMKSAMKNKDMETLKVIRMIQARIKDADIASRGQNTDSGVSDNEIIALLKNMVKQRTESAKMYTDANRSDLADIENAEILVIQDFLPPMMSEAEISNAVDTAISATGASSMADMGKVMGTLKANHDATLDMGIASKILKEKLS